MNEQTEPVKNNKARNDGLAAVAAFALAAALHHHGHHPFRVAIGRTLQVRPQAQPGTSPLAAF